MSTALVAQRVSTGWTGYDVNLRGHALLGAITAACATGFLLVGYDNGVFGGLVNVPAFERTFADKNGNPPSADTISNIVSLYEIGAFIGALSTFVVGESFGRRNTILFGAAWMVAGAIWQAAASSVGVMIAGRIVSGIGMGAINSTVPVLQAEMSPATSRGKLVAIDLIILNCGIVLSYWIDYAFNFSSGNIKNTNAAWRVPVALQLVFIVFIILVTLVIPDTPRWLVKRGRIEDATRVLERLHNRPRTDAKVQNDLQGIESALEHEQREAQKARSLSYLIGPGGGLKDDTIRTRRRLLLACFIQFAQQFGGINGLIYYSSTLFQKSIGLGGQESALLAGGLNMCLILGSIFTYFLVDRVGRRALLLPCIAGMAAVMAVQTGLVYKVQQGGNTAIYGRAASAMLFVFEFFFSLGFQATVWLIPSEVLPLSIRTYGSALSTATNWLSNFAVVKFTPIAIQNIGYQFYIVFAVLNAAWLPVIYFFLPETANRTLEEMDELFATDGWHVQRVESGHVNTILQDELPAPQKRAALDRSEGKELHAA